MDKYYVYAHSKPDGEVFYVGKGSGKRLFATGNRSEFWKRIVAKYGYIIQIIEECSDEKKAFESEIYWIAHYRKYGQCIANFTNGGDGVRVEKRWWNDKISESLKGIKRPSGELSHSYKNIITKDVLQKLYVIDRMSATKIATIYNVSYGIIFARLKEYGIKIRSVGREKRSIKCVTDGRCFSSLSEAAEYYGLFRENISKVLNGKYKHTGHKVFIYLIGDSNEDK